MAELVKGLDLGALIKRKSKELLSNVDLSGVKLPDAKADVELGEETRAILKKIALGVGVFVILKMLKLF